MAVFDHTAHKELWNCLSDSPSKVKGNWPGWKDNGGTYKEVENGCFACTYAIEMKKERKNADDYCKYCPLEGWDEKHQCDDSGDLFDLWFHATNLEERANYARQIRDLPVKPGVETI